jgi:hypothetical protein
MSESSMRGVRVEQRITSSQLPNQRTHSMAYVLAGGLIAGTLDILYACTFWAVKSHMPAQRVFQDVAAGLLGEASFQGRMARITVEELKDRLDANDSDFIIVDTRSVLDVNTTPYGIPGAIWITAEDIGRRYHEIPTDRESARVALMLKHNGISRVRPLQGGLNLWMDRNSPLRNSKSRVHRVRLLLLRRVTESPRSPKSLKPRQAMASKWTYEMPRCLG